MCLPTFFSTNTTELKSCELQINNEDYSMYHLYNKQVLFHAQLSTVRGKLLKMGEVSKLTYILNE
jgi:hypothetical protein